MMEAQRVSGKDDTGAVGGRRMTISQMVSTSKRQTLVLEDLKNRTRRRGKMLKGGKWTEDGVSRWREAEAEAEDKVAAAAGLSASG